MLAALQVPELHFPILFYCAPADDPLACPEGACDLMLV